MISRYGVVLAIAASIVAPSLLAAGGIEAANAIDNVEFSQQGIQTLVKVSFRGRLDKAPASFSTSNPYRVAFDFPNVASNLGVTTKQAGVGSLQSAAVIQSDTRTRLVLNLSGPAQHSTTVEGNVLYINLVGSANTVNSVVMPSTFSASRDSKVVAPPPLITSVDFQAVSIDQANIKIDLTDPSALLDVKQQGSSLVLFFASTELQDRLEKRLDVRDFGTPVATLTTARSGRGVQVALVNRGEWDYSVRQIDTSVLLEIRRVKTDPNNLANAKQMQGKVVSFNFTQPVPISQMIGIFQDISGLNFMVMPGVTGEIQSLKMENTPVTVAIDVISRMYGLAFRRYGDVVVVGKSDDLAKYDKEERDRMTAMEGVEPVTQESVRVRYRPAGEIVQALLGGGSQTPGEGGSTQGGGMQSSGAVTSYQPQQNSPSAPQNGGNAPQATVGGTVKSLISSRGSITYDAITNTIFIEETKAQLDKIRERVAVLDRPTRQVMIEARIVNVKDDFTRTLGAKLGFLRTSNNAVSSGTIPASANSPSGVTTTYGSGQQSNVSGGFDASQGAKATNLVLSLLNSNQTRLLNLQLSASESDNVLKSVASPKIITQDGRQATITNGQSICFQLYGGTSGPTTSCIDAATKLDVTPQINPDGKVQLKLYVNKGEPAANVGGLVTTNKREIKTNVVVENGGTLMLGGVFEDSVTNNTDRVPFLGDLPYVGFLFKENMQQRTRTELLIFITPRIVSEDLALQ